tara:strand:- start:416 stop:1420 length:1005 start_codon:yes stop_codon:yes gene_type:complete
MTKRVGIIGCGKILPRHVEAIHDNQEYELVSICDTNKDSLSQASKIFNATPFKDYKDMVKGSDINFVVIATPNSQHYQQAVFCLQNNCDVLIEKPATLNPFEIDKIVKVAKDNDREAYAVLQVRLNSCIQNLKELIDKNVMGKIRGFGLIQRWQRPLEYFSDWRGIPEVGGGTLHECGIHYLDILCYLLGEPKVVSSKKYNTKHFGTEIEDTIYSTLDFGHFGGNIEVSISCEPKNLECSLSLITEKGYIKLGGKAMNTFEEVQFSTKSVQKKVENLIKQNSFVGTPNSYGAYAGSCPNHPELYRNLQDFNLTQTKSVLYLIDQIYEKCNIKYY